MFRSFAVAWELDDLFADPIEPQAARRQHVGGDAAVLTEQSEQQVLGPDVTVPQSVGFLRGVLQHTLGGSAERDLH